MTQRVNLLTEDIKPSRPILSFKHSFGVLGLVVGLFVVMSAYEGFRFHSLDVQRIDLAANLGMLKLATERMNDLEANSAKLEMEKAIAALSRRFVLRSQSLAALERADLLSRDGFSGYLNGLAEHRVDGLWLTGIGIESGGRIVRLAGNAVKAVHVPELLGLLARDTEFDGLRFEQLRLDVDESGTVKFTIGPKHQRR